MIVHLDIRTKIILLFFINALLLIEMTGFYEWLLILCLCLWLWAEGERRRSAIYFLVFLCLFGLQEWLMVSGGLTSYMAMLTIGGRALLPCFMVGGSILRSSVHEFIAGMRSWHMPESLLLAIAVMMRFLPTIKESYQNIRASLKTRGIFVSKWDIIWHPLQFFEQVTLPLFMMATKTSQDLTIASLTKSVGQKGKKTSYIDYRFSWADYLAYACMIGVLVIYSLGVGR